MTNPKPGRTPDKKITITRFPHPSDIEALLKGEDGHGGDLQTCKAFALSMVADACVLICHALNTSNPPDKGDSDVEMLRSDWDAFIKRKFPEVSITGKRPVSRRGQPGKHVGHKEPAKPPGYAVRPKDESFRSYGIPTREDEPIWESPPFKYSNFYTDQDIRQPLTPAQKIVTEGLGWMFFPYNVCFGKDYAEPSYDHVLKGLALQRLHEVSRLCGPAGKAGQYKVLLRAYLMDMVIALDPTIPMPRDDIVGTSTAAFIALPWFRLLPTFASPPPTPVKRTRDDEDYSLDTRDAYGVVSVHDSTKITKTLARLRDYIKERIGCHLTGFRLSIQLWKAFKEDLSGDGDYLRLLIIKIEEQRPQYRGQFAELMLHQAMYILSPMRTFGCSCGQYDVCPSEFLMLCYQAYFFELLAAYAVYLEIRNAQPNEKAKLRADAQNRARLFVRGYRGRDEEVDPQSAGLVDELDALYNARGGRGRGGGGRAPEGRGRGANADRGGRGGRGRGGHYANQLYCSLCRINGRPANEHLTKDCPHKVVKTG